MLTGSMVAMVTPMNGDGSIDWAGLERLIEHHVDQGTDAIVSVGTTGESATLNHGEHAEVIERTVKAVAGRIPVIGGTGSNSTEESIALTRTAQQAGVRACLLVVPYYNKPPQEGLYQHFRSIAEAVSVPQILYNVPGRTACDMVPDTVGRLAALENIIGIKEATAEVNRVAEIRERAGEEFLLLSGDDATACDFLLAGGHGVISVTANVAPRLMHELCSAVLQGDAASARDIDSRLQALHRDLFLEANPIPVKWAVHELGLVKAGIRLPLTWLSEQYRDKVKAAMNYAEVTIQVPASCVTFE